MPPRHTVPDIPAAPAGFRPLSKHPMSLLDYLTAPIPPISARRGVKNPKSKSKSKPNTDNLGWDDPCQVQRWEEFDRVDRATLSEIYPELRESRRHRPEFGETDPLFAEVWNEAAVQSVVKDWNATIVCEALKETQELLGHEDRIYMALGCFSQPLDSGSSSRPFFPDWAAVRKSQEWKPGQPAAPKSIMPGDTKISTGWVSSEIESGETDFAMGERPNWFKPLAQIFTYCFKLEVRYGYLITDQELVVVRIGPYSENGMVTTNQTIPDADENWRLEFATVPWAQEESGDSQEESNNSRQEGSNSLTVNLALWWLHLLAAKDSSIQWKYPPLKEEALRGRKQSTLHRQEQPPHLHVESQQTYDDTEPDTEPDTDAEVTIPGNENDRFTHSFDVNPGSDLESSVVPNVMTRSRKRSLTDGQQTYRRKLRRRPLNTVDEGD